MAWTQLFIRTPAGNGYTTPQTMRRVDEHLQMIGACMHCPDNTRLPVQEPDGTWQVRVMDASQAEIVKAVIRRDYGLIIEKEEIRD